MTKNPEIPFLQVVWCYRSGRLPKRWHAIGKKLVRMVAVQMGFGCGIDGAVVFDCGELLPNYQSVVVGLWLRLISGDRFEYRLRQRRQRASAAATRSAAISQ